jgi:hypothetical protein
MERAMRGLVVLIAWLIAASAAGAARAEITSGGHA